MQRNAFDRCRKRFSSTPNDAALQDELFDGDCHPVFVDGREDVVGDCFERRDGIPHGEAETRPFDHFEIICLIADCHNGIAGNVELPC